jgi:hypothetical protein
MSAAECTVESFQAMPNLFGFKVVKFKVYGTTNSDYVTFSTAIAGPAAALTVIRGFSGLFATEGTAGTATITGTSNVLTITNAAGLTWHGLVWGD